MRKKKISVTWNSDINRLMNKFSGNLWNDVESKIKTNMHMNKGLWHLYKPRCMFFMQ